MMAVVKFAQVPECLQFNEFILYGYDTHDGSH